MAWILCEMSRVEFTYLTGDLALSFLAGLCCLAAGLLMFCLFYLIKSFLATVEPRSYEADFRPFAVFGKLEMLIYSCLVLLESASMMLSTCCWGETRL